MSNIPALPPPFGVKSDFDTPPSQREVLVIVNSICIFLMLIYSALQVYAKTFIIHIPFGLEDGTCFTHPFLKTSLDDTVMTSLSVVDGLRAVFGDNRS